MELSSSSSEEEDEVAEGGKGEGRDQGAAAEESVPLALADVERTASGVLLKKKVEPGDHAQVPYMQWTASHVAQHYHTCMHDTGFRSVVGNPKAKMIIFSQTRKLFTARKSLCVAPRNTASHEHAGLRSSPASLLLQ